MRFGQPSVEGLKDLARALVAGVLCVLLVGQPLVTAAAVGKPVVASTKQIQGEQRLLACFEPFYVWASAGGSCGGPGDWVEAVVRAAVESFEHRRFGAGGAAGDVSGDEDGAGGDVSAVSEPAGVAADDCEEYSAAVGSGGTCDLCRRDCFLQGGEGQAGGETGCGCTRVMRRRSPPAMANDAEWKDKTALPGDDVDPGVPAMATHEEQFYSGTGGGEDYQPASG